MQPTVALKRTPFYEFHRQLGAKLVEFAGFEMPLRYTGDQREHLAVRNAAGLFDISHMGEFRVRGRQAGAFLQRMVTNDVLGAEVGQAVYSPMCRPDGGIVDDLIVYRFADHWMVVVNASTTAKDFAWLKEHVPAEVSIDDDSDDTALLAVQGPRAAEMLRGHIPDAALALGTYRFLEGRLFGAPAIVSRTGYTGEDGFELYFDRAHAAPVWEGLMAAGGAVGLEPVGLGARDTLRLEMGYMLYGNDIDDTTTPIEAGLGWTVKFDAGDFLGRDALLAQKQHGTLRKLVGFALEGRRVPRHDMVIEAEGRPVGVVTSGSFSPSLKQGIGMGYVEPAYARLGTPLEIAANGARLDAKVVKRPFWTHGSRRS
ncbi:MAG TPA: glycine cleavage system aminomethyltransferase GcvT [Candidatus Eisenbacteria bacterium]|nr:glycine cleavage system aminomethyltransferase GcvT [Candidatus Eisenbacteria bacterium]